MARTAHATRTSRSPQTPLRLVAYSRVSTLEQAREGISLAAQRERLAAYAFAHGAELVAVEADNGTSGKVAPAKREGLSKALHRIRQREADGLLVLKLDRLSRSTRHVLDLMDDCRRKGWRIVSVSESLDTGTAAGRLVVTVLAALAEMEREQVGERTSEALAHVGRQGRARSHRTPFGWRTAAGSTAPIRGDRSPLVPDAQEQELLAAMLELAGDGFGARRIARALNDQGHANPRTEGPWSPGTVAAVLRTAERRALLTRN